MKAGSTFASGRPYTGRSKAVSVRLTEVAYEILKTKKNKSAYIDRLIRIAESSKLFDNLE